MAAGLPPTAVIFEDPAHTEWTRWDFRLLKAYHIHQGMLNENGVPIHWDRSDRVAFDVGTVRSKSAAALERRMEAATKNGKKDEPGKRYYPIPRTIDGGPMPSLREFNEEQRAKRGDK